MNTVPLESIHPLVIISLFAVLHQNKNKIKVFRYPQNYLKMYKENLKIAYLISTHSLIVLLQHV